MCGLLFCFAFSSYEWVKIRSTSAYTNGLFLKVIFKGRIHPTSLAPPPFHFGTD